MRFKNYNGNLRKANPVELSRLMPFVVKAAGLEIAVVFENLKKNWNNILGETAARNIKPVSLENGNLVVTVSTSSWITQARFLKPSIISKINTMSSQEKEIVKDITFVLDSSIGKTEARKQL